MARIALREYWPGTATGERETLNRIEKALQNLGHDVFYVQAGTVDERSTLEQKKPLFLLDIHFAFPAPRNVFCVGALWNPIEYYTLWRGSESLEIQFQHDMFLAANPELAEMQLKIFRPDLKHPILPFNHSVSVESLLDPIALTTPSVFYSGIGWDRSSLEGHRNEQILRFFEEESLLRLFGPKRLSDGTRPWADFKSSYLGEIPFDGNSIFQEINSSTFYLCLSSESHRRNNIASNRLFEAIAGGALPIVDSDLMHPFSTKHVVQFSRDIPIDEALTKLHSEMLEIIADPYSRVQRVQVLQEELKNNYTFESQLKSLVSYVANLDLDARNISTRDGETETVASIFALIGGNPQSGLPLADPISISMSLFNYSDLTKYKYLSFSESDLILKTDRYRDWTSGEPHVLHVPGNWQSPEESIFLGVDGTAPGLRMADTLIVRSDIVKLWIQESAGAASVGALLLACVEDSRSRNPRLNHHFVNDFALNLSESVSASTITSLASSLDSLSLVRLSRASKTVVGDLAALARYTLLHSSPLDSSPLFPRLYSEVRMLGLYKVFRLTLSKIVAMVLRRDSKRK